MLARRYTKKIEIWIDVAEPDGFGGFTNVPTLVKKAWCEIATMGAGYKYQDNGLNDFKNPMTFRCRKGSLTITEDNFIKYKGRIFIIKGIENVNLEGVEINILADEK